MKKLLSVLLGASMLVGLLAACGGSSDSGNGTTDDGGAAVVDTDDGGSDAGAAGDASDSEGEVYMFISQPEYADAINALIDEYKTVAPNVTINYETTQNDYPILLKAKLNSGDTPDIFSSTTGKEIDMYLEYSMDLSGQPLADAMLDSVAKNMATTSGEGIYGFAIKGNYFGLIYNEEIFDELNLDVPKTIDDFETACQTLADAGYTPLTSGFAEWWVFKHIFQHFVSASTDDAAALISAFESGEASIADYPELYDNFFRFIDLCIEYGDAKPLEADLNTEIAQFATGNAAMIIGQGAWVEADILAINPDAKIGFTGYPVTNNPADAQVITGSDQAMRVSNTASQATLDFINWWYTSDYGQAWFTDVADVVLPIESTGTSDSAIINAGDAEVAANGSGDLTIIYSTDSFHTAFGEAIQQYISGTDKDSVVSAVMDKWVELDGADD